MSESPRTVASKLGFREFDRTGTEEETIYTYTNDSTKENLQISVFKNAFDRYEHDWTLFDATLDNVLGSGVDSWSLERFFIRRDKAKEKEIEEESENLEERLYYLEKELHRLDMEESGGTCKFCKKNEPLDSDGFCFRC